MAVTRADELVLPLDSHPLVVSLPAVLAGWAILRESHPLDNLLKLRTIAERIKTRILGQSEELHVSLLTSSVEPYNHLTRLAEGGVCCGNVIGWHAPVRRGTLE